MTTDIEDRLPEVLRHLATDVHAPATLEAGRAVRHRATALRRHRRRLRAGVGAGVVAATAAVALAWPSTWPSTGGHRPEVSTDPAAGGTGVDADSGVPPGEPGVLPALTIDHPRATVVAALDETASARPTREDHPPEDPDGDATVTRQLFRRPGDPAGPIVYVTSGPLELVEEQLGGTVEPLRFGVRTHLVRLGDGRGIQVNAVGLDAAGLAAFADGLVPAPGGTGWRPTAGPGDLVELPLGPVGATAPHPERVLWFAVDGRPRAASMHLETWLRTDPEVIEAAFLHRVYGRQRVLQDVRPVEVLGRPGVLVEIDDHETVVVWRHTTTDIAELFFVDVDPATVEELVAGLRELGPEEWTELEASVPGLP